MTTRLTRLIVLCIAMVIVLLSLSVCAKAEEDSNSSQLPPNESMDGSTGESDPDASQISDGEDALLPDGTPAPDENSTMSEEERQEDGLEETAPEETMQTPDIPGEGGSTESPDEASLEREALRAKILAEREKLQDEQEVKVKDELVLRLVKEKLEKKKALEESQSVGISPENVLYPLDRISKSIQLAMTAKGYERSIKAMEILDERLLEVKQATQKTDFSSLRNAKDSYDATSLSLQLAMDEVEDEPLKELRQLLELEYHLEMHQLSLKQIQLNALREIKEKLTEKEYQGYEGMFTILNLDMKETSYKLNQRIENTKIKIRLTESMSDAEINNLEAGLESSIAAGNEDDIAVSFLIGLTEKQIEKAKESISQRKTLEQDTASDETALEESQEMLRKAKIAYAINSTDIETVKVYTQEAKRKAADARLE